MTHFVDLLELTFLQNVLLIILVVSACIKWNARVVFVLFFVNFGAFFSPVYYAFLLANGEIHVFSILGLIFELTVLLFSLSLSNKMIISFDEVINYNKSKIIASILIFKLVVVIILLKSGSWGVYSNGIRTEFTVSDWYLKYLVYLGRFIDLWAVLILAGVLKSKRGLGRAGALLLVIIIGSGFLSGSKGSFFFLTMLLLVLVGKEVSKKKFFRFVILGFLVGIPAFFNVLAERLKLSSSEMANLLVKRFYLNNDTRALSLDYRGEELNTTFFSESFRSLSSFLGIPPKLPPVGVLLYQSELSIIGGEGGNASFIALLTVFTNVEGSTYIWFISVLLVLVLYYLFFKSPNVVSKRFEPSFKMMGVVLIGFVSQDFLAYQLIFRLVFIISLVYIILRSFERVISNNSRIRL